MVGTLSDFCLDPPLEQSGTEQSRAERTGTEKNKPEQNRTEQNRTEQNRTEQNKIVAKMVPSSNIYAKARILEFKTCLENQSTMRQKGV